MGFAKQARTLFSLARPAFRENHMQPSSHLTYGTVSALAVLILAVPAPARADPAYSAGRSSRSF